MDDRNKTKDQLLAELAELRRSIADLRAVKTTANDKEQLAISLLEAAPLGVHLCDRDGRIVFANPAQEHITGYKAEELIGTYIWDRTVPGPQRDALPSYLKRLAEEQPTPAPYFSDNVKKNGESYRIRVDWNYQRDALGRVTGFACIVSDISQQEKAQAELRQSEERYRQLAESTSDIVYVLDRDGVLRYANQSAAASFGCSAEELIGRRQEDLFPPETAQRHLERIRRVFETGQAAEMDALYHLGPKAVWLNVRSIPLFDEQGRVASMLGVCRDITDRKLAEEALRQAHEELGERAKQRAAELARSNEDRAIFRRFAEAAGQGFGIADLDGRLVYLNAALCRIYGEAAPEDAVGRHLLTYYPEQYAQRRRDEVWPALEKKGYWEGVQEVLARGGRKVPTLHNSFLIRDEKGAPAYLATVITDLTELVQAREALRQSHDQLKAIYDGMTDGLLVVAVETMRFVRANASMCRMLGYREEELLERTVADIHPISELPKVMEGFEALSEGRQPGVQDIAVQRKDGSVFYADITASRVVYDGRDCAIGFFRDRTERRQAREALEREHRVLRQMLQAQDRERQLIAYEIHDELAQELAGAIMQFQAFRELNAAGSPKAPKVHDEGVAMLQRGLAEARRLISGLRPPILDESGVVAAIRHLVHEIDEQQRTTVEFHCRVDFDRLEPTLENALYRIVQESLTNACRHANCEQVTVTLRQEGSSVRVEVVDDGVGFDPTSVRPDCYGLEGIRERARVLGGRATISSAAGHGTRVAVELPLVPIA